jgi:hypothetical protein
MKKGFVREELEWLVRKILIRKCGGPDETTFEAEDDDEELVGVRLVGTYIIARTREEEKTG